MAARSNVTKNKRAAPRSSVRYAVCLSCAIQQTSLIWENSILTFVIPVRHQDTVRDWAVIKDHLAITIASLAAQKNAPWNAIVVANEGADLPAMPDRVKIVRVDFPANSLPVQDRASEAFFAAVRSDKGSRILHGLVRGGAAGHVMFVDHDDLVSNRLAELVASAPDSNGWFLDQGYIFSGGPEVYAYDKNFHKLCGTSHIVRADLLRIPARVEEAGLSYISLWLGSHVFIKDELDKEGAPLAPLPFSGAIYRIGHPDATSGSPTLREVIRDRSRGDPEARERLLRKMMPMTAKIADEFFAGVAR